MFAVVIRESGDPALIDASAAMVEAAVAPRVRQAPGFVSAVWTSDGSGGTVNVVTFDSEEAARAGAEAARIAQRPPFLRLETVDVVKVLASA